MRGSQLVAKRPKWVLSRLSRRDRHCGADAGRAPRSSYVGAGCDVLYLPDGLRSEEVSAWRAAGGKDVRQTKFRLHRPTARDWKWKLCVRWRWKLRYLCRSTLTREAGQHTTGGVDPFAQSCS